MDIMSKDIEKKAEELIMPILDSLGFELWDVEYVKEGGEKYLRAYIDKPGGITIDDCEAVSRQFSDKLDEADFIDEAYIMEVSSPGLGRTLKKDKDFERCIGRAVEVKLYSPMQPEGSGETSKEFEGELVRFDKDTLVIRNDETEISFMRSSVAVVKLAVLL